MCSSRPAFSFSADFMKDSPGGPAIGACPRGVQMSFGSCSPQAPHWARWLAESLSLHPAGSVCALQALCARCRLCVRAAGSVCALQALLGIWDWGVCEHGSIFLVYQRGSKQNNPLVKWFLRPGRCVLSCPHTRRRAEYTEVPASYRAVLRALEGHHSCPLHCEPYFN